ILAALWASWPWLALTYLGVFCRYFIRLLCVAHRLARTIKSPHLITLELRRFQCCINLHFFALFHSGLLLAQMPPSGCFPCFHLTRIDSAAGSGRQMRKTSMSGCSARTRNRVLYPMRGKGCFEPLGLAIAQGSVPTIPSALWRN